MIDAIPRPEDKGPKVLCEDCGQRLFLMRGVRSQQWFYTHTGLSGCFDTRAIFFPTREEAEQASEIFQ
jgi:hypothetical protein